MVGGPAVLWRIARDRRVRYLFAGGVAAVVFYGSFAGGWLLSGGRVPYLLMAVVANAVTTIVTYPLYRTVVFGSAAPWLSGFARFYVICLGALAFTAVGLPALVEIAHLPVLLAQAILILVVPLVNYQLNRYWTFRHRPAPPVVVSCGPTRPTGE
jgi:putative flippase GtrA